MLINMGNKYILVIEVKKKLFYNLQPKKINYDVLQQVNIVAKLNLYIFEDLRVFFSVLIERLTTQIIKMTF